MTKTTWLATLALAALLAAPRTVDAAFTGPSGWALSGRDTLRVGSYRATKTAITPTDSFFTADQHFSVFASFLNYTGTWKASGKRGFKVTLDPGSLQTIQNYLAAKAQARTGASSVIVRSLKVKISGSVSKDGTKLTMKTTMVLRGVAIVGKHRLAGAVTDTESFKGVPAA